MIFIRVIPAGTPLVQVRLNGRACMLSAAELGLDARADDAAICGALAAYFGAAAGQFAACTVERYVNGNIAVRPEVVFG